MTVTLTLKDRSSQAAPSSRLTSDAFHLDQKPVKIRTDRCTHWKRMGEILTVYLVELLEVVPILNEDVDLKDMFETAACSRETRLHVFHNLMGLGSKLRRNDRWVGRPRSISWNLAAKEDKTVVDDYG